MLFAVLATAAVAAVVCGVPVPCSDSDNIRVGVIRWDAWNGDPYDAVSGTVRRVMTPPQYHSRLPFFANVSANGTVNFNEDDADVMARELQLAAGAGLSFFAFDTYCAFPSNASIPQCQLYAQLQPGYTPTNPSYGLTQYLASPHSARVNFSLLLLSAPAGHPEFRPGYLQHFRDSRYERVGDRPLVFLFQISDAAAADGWGGWAAWRAQFDALRNESMAAGLGNPYMVAMTTGNMQQAEAYRQQLGFDAVSAYALPGGTNAGLPFTHQLAAQQAWLDGAAAAGVPTVPIAPTGWDPRPRNTTRPSWTNETGRHYDAPTPAQVARVVTAGAQWACEHPSLAAAQRVLVYAWQECTEGGWLIPTFAEHTARLDAVAGVLPYRCGA